MSQIIFVSCFINIYNNNIIDADNNNNGRGNEWRLNHFKSLLDTGITVMLFISPEFNDMFKKVKLIYPNLTYYTIDVYTELPLFINRPNTPLLPETRNGAKDTYEYMALMNSKLEFVKRAIDIMASSYYFAWIDFNIAYIFKEAPITLSFFNFLSKQRLQERFLYIPGCWDTPPKNSPLITDYVHWHICGGFFLGDKHSLLQFYRATNDHLREQFIDKGLMTWETNYWAFLEANDIWMPSHWTRVLDHDDTMITRIPTEIYINPFLWNYIHPYDFDTLGITIDGYHPSSITYTQMNDGICTDNDELLICRMINYRLSHDGRQYIYSSPNNTIDNINILINLTRGETRILSVEQPAKFEREQCFSNGLEDIRLYPDLSFTANSVSYTTGKVPQIVYGHIDRYTGRVVDLLHIQSPRGIDECEKNWIVVKKCCVREGKERQHIIYRWQPFEIGVINKTKTETGLVLDIITSVNLTPQYIFKNMRGSTPFHNITINRGIGCHYNGDWLVGATHYSIDQSHTETIVRKYYHCLVLLNPQTLIPHIITSPFTFGEIHGIEFCTGMRYADNIFTFWVSIMDELPMTYYIHEDNIDFNILVSTVAPIH